MHLCPPVGCRFHPDSAAVRLHDAGADGQADARTGELAAMLQSDKRRENAILLIRRDADAVVADDEVPVIALFEGAHGHMRGLSAELGGIAAKILE